MRSFTGITRRNHKADNQMTRRSALAKAAWEGVARLQ